MHLCVNRLVFIVSFAVMSEKYVGWRQGFVCAAYS
ncbi:hypothetical protein BH24CHL1_BH24CHL1_19930 [soil metagenome]